jgi:hypothetical protein
MGLANCPYCGARVGTVFSEQVTPVEPPPKKRKSAQPASPLYEMERVKSRANNSLILALGSFLCPGIGVALSLAAILMGLNARQAYVRAGLEDGRGTATGGIVIGAISLVAQVCYLVYFLKSGISF